MSELGAIKAKVDHHQLGLKKARGGRGLSLGNEISSLCKSVSFVSGI